MEAEKDENADLERLCQGVSPRYGNCTYPATIHCTYPATIHCTTCSKWFWDAHAEDEHWHACMLSGQ
jgi:hypothetical protein